MPPVNPATSPSSASRTAAYPDISNPEEQHIWYDAIDHVEMQDTWITPREEHHADPSSTAGEAAESWVPFTEDCRRCVQQLVRTLGETGESKMLSYCLSKILPGTPASLVIAANSLYTAVTERRNIDAAALHALGLVSWCLPDNINIVSQLAGYIRNTVTDWTNETFLQQFLGNEENHTSSHLFTALAVTAIVAGCWMKDKGPPQRGILKVPAFMANLFIRASHYWTALGNMARSLPSGAEIPGPSRRTPAFEVDTQVEMTGNVFNTAVPYSSSAPRLTAFSSNSTAFPEAYTRATVQKRPASVPKGNYSISIPEQVHSLTVDKLRQESGLSDLLYCTTLKTETRQQTNEKVVTDTFFNTKCDATVYPEPLRNAANGIPVHTDIPETQVTSSTTSQGGGDVLLPLVMTSAVPMATSYMQALKSKTVIAVGITAGLAGAGIGGKWLRDKLSSQNPEGKHVNSTDDIEFPEDSFGHKALHHTGPENIFSSSLHRANLRVKKLLYSKGLLANKKAVSMEKLLYLVSVYLFYGNKEIAEHEKNKKIILARKILSASGLYGGDRGEPISTAQANFTVRSWIFDNILGMPPDKYIESKIKADNYPGYFTIDSVHHFLAVDKLPAESRINFDKMNFFEETALLLMWKSFLLEEMPFLVFSGELVMTMSLNDFDFANLYSGSRFLKSTGVEGFTYGEAISVGKVMWDLAVKEGVTIDKLALYRAPALFFTYSNSSKKRMITLKSSDDTDAINNYIKHRGNVERLHKDINDKYDNYVSVTKKWLSKGKLADNIISQCPTLRLGIIDHGDILRTKKKQREKSEKFSKQDYLNGFSKPCQAAPDSLDDEYKKLTADVADSFQEIDKYLIRSAIGTWVKEFKNERKFIQSPAAVIHTATLEMKTIESYSGYGFPQQDLRISLNKTDLFSVRQGEQERIYALSGITSDNKGYRLIRLDRDIHKYISSRILDSDVHDEYKVTNDIALGPVVIFNGRHYSYSIFNQGKAISNGSNNIDYLIYSLSEKHRDILYHSLYELGNDKSDLDKTWSVVKHIIPFFDCVEGIINNDPVQAVPSCLMDAMAFIPVFGSAVNLSTKFGTGLGRGLRGSAVIMGKEGIKSAGKNLFREVSMPTTRELALLGKGALRAIDPGFEQIVSIGSISREFGSKIVNLMSGNKKTAELTKKIASSNVLDLLPQVQANVKVMGILPETQLQVPVKVIGKHKGRDIYVHVNPETGNVGGSKYFCFENGNLELVSSVLGKNIFPKNTSHRVKRGGNNPNLCPEPGTSSGTRSAHKKIRKQENRQMAVELILKKEIVSHKDIIIISKKTGVPVSVLSNMDEYKSRRPRKERPGKTHGNNDSPIMHAHELGGSHNAAVEIRQPNPNEIKISSSSSSSSAETKILGKYILTETYNRDLLFPELQGIHLSQNSIDVNIYRIGFNNLPRQQQDAIKEWTKAPGINSYPLSLQLNEWLRNDDITQMPHKLRELYYGLYALFNNPPSFMKRTGDYIRIEHYFSNEKIPFIKGQVNSIKAGDIVNTKNTFTSFSGKTNLVDNVISKEKDIKFGKRPIATVIYKVEKGEKGLALLEGVATEGKNVDEQLYGPKSRFKIKEISIAKPKEGEDTHYRIAVVLEEIDIPSTTSVKEKKWHTGEDIINDTRTSGAQKLPSTPSAGNDFFRSLLNAPPKEFTNKKN